MLIGCMLLWRFHMNGLNHPCCCLSASTNEPPLLICIHMSARVLMLLRCQHS